MLESVRISILSAWVLMLMGCGGHAREAGESRRPEWVQLASRPVDFAGDHDVIELGGNDRFTSIRLAVDEGDLVMDHIRITFRNGERFEPQTRAEFREGSRSREIDLPGNGRFVRRIEFFYRSIGRHGRAVVTVFGRLK